MNTVEHSHGKGPGGADLYPLLSNMIGYSYEQCSASPCDLNGDGHFTRMDIFKFAYGCIKGWAPWTCDRGGDGHYRIDDVFRFALWCMQRQSP